MAQIYLTHPVHGTKIASLDAEVEHDEKFGWTRYNPDQSPESEDEVAVNTLSLKRKYIRKVEQIGE
jgi:hypothetical protein